MKRNIIYLYNDLGVSAESIKHILGTLKQIISPEYKIHFIDASEIMENKWAKHTALLIMPGGRDLYYAKQLKTSGNRSIKDYVKNGGSYLGICAGAYYGSEFVEFDKNGPLEVLGKRELAFFPNKAIGPALARYNYENNSGARAALIKLSVSAEISNLLFDKVMVYYNGGPYFEYPQLYKNVNIIASYQLSDKSTLPAILKINYDKGNVILSGVHFEYSPELLNMNDKFHAQIIPKLEQSENDRIEFAVFILKTLNIRVVQKFLQVL